METLPKLILSSNFQQILLSHDSVLVTLLGAGDTKMNNVDNINK